MSTENQTTKAVIGPVRFSYCHVFEPHALEEGGEKKYSVSLIIPKKDKKIIAQINAAIEAATTAGLPKWGGKKPPKFKNPLRDGDEDKAESPEYEGAWFLNATSKTKPNVVDKNRSPIMEQSEFKSGDYGFASVNFFPFDKAGNRGVACGLNNLMKTKDGEALGGRVSAEEDFADIKVEDDDDYDFS